MRNSRITSQALIALVLAAGLARADQVAVGFDVEHPSTLGTGQGVYGWQFTANAPLEILTVGIYDNYGIFGGGYVGDGLVEPHVISIWDVANHSTPLLSAATPLGMAAPLRDGFRYVPITPIVLQPGHDYVISATYPNVSIPVNPNKDWTGGGLAGSGFQITVGPGLTFGGYRGVADSSGLSIFPPYLYPNDLYAFGPNFSYQVIPEPSLYALVATGVSVLCRRYKSSRL